MCILAILEQLSIMLAYFARDKHLFASLCLAVSIDTGHKASLCLVVSTDTGHKGASKKWNGFDGR
eukprot:COSAG02_NODE_28174_length_594_cov_2.264646_1_plen_65_part_00